MTHGYWIINMCKICLPLSHSSCDVSNLRINFIWPLYSFTPQYASHSIHINFHRFFSLFIYPILIYILISVLPTPVSLKPLSVKFTKYFLENY
jgi:hypothetical protein